jgi:tetratricopeptide (TPR) repeat protein
MMNSGIEVRVGRAKRIMLAAILAVAAIGLGGCSSGSKAEESYLDAYKSKEYPKALALSESTAKRSTGPAKEQASLIAGLSAHALNKDDEAEEWLRPLSINAKSDEVAGRAGATLGLIAMDRRQFDAAANQLSTAGEKLSGDEGARAWLYAGDAYRQIGSVDKAKAAYVKAESEVQSNTELRLMIAQRRTSPINPPAGPPYNGAVGSSAPSGARFTIQMGAFTTMASAQDAAKRLGRQAMTIGVPYIVQTAGKDGKSMYALRVGGFATREQARMRAGTGPKGSIVVPVK